MPTTQGRQIVPGEKLFIFCYSFITHLKFMAQKKLRQIYLAASKIVDYYVTMKPIREQMKLEQMRQRKLNTQQRKTRMLQKQRRSANFSSSSIPNSARSASSHYNNNNNNNGANTLEDLESELNFLKLELNKMKSSSSMSISSPNSSRTDNTTSVPVTPHASNNNQLSEIDDLVSLMGVASSSSATSNTPDADTASTKLNTKHLTAVMIPSGFTPSTVPTTNNNVPPPPPPPLLNLSAITNKQTKPADTPANKPCSEQSASAKPEIKRTMSIADMIKNRGDLKLKTVNVARSPGGTPMRSRANSSVNGNPHSSGINNDFVSALMNKFKNITHGNNSEPNSPLSSPERDFDDKKAFKRVGGKNERQESPFKTSPFKSSHI